ncbi:MAG: hypothetical protein NTV34_12860 [Proteobacteria bacterium]|nr:hypothetical protein [Pseudomonadota bacterium]
MKTKVSPRQFEQYFQCSTRTERLNILRKWEVESHYITDAMLADLFRIPLSNHERIALLEATEPTNPLEYEKWIFKNLTGWSQDVAAIALRSWANTTRCHLWHRLIAILKIPGLPQRMSFTIIDISPKFAGKQITSTILQSPGWEDFSPAYHGILFERSIEFDCPSTRLSSLALKILGESKSHMHPENKCLISAGVWLLKSNQTKQLVGILESRPECHWKSLLTSAVLEHSQRKKSLEKLQKNFAKGDSDVQADWEAVPHSWSRGEVTPELLGSMLNRLKPSTDQISLLFAGVPESTIKGSVQFTTDSDSILAASLRWIGSAPAPSSDIATERDAALGRANSDERTRVSSAGDDATKATDPAPYLSVGRSNYFGVLGGLEPETGASRDFWDALAQTWFRQSSDDLQRIVVESRRQSGLATISYLSTLGRLKGSDEAVLKIMDHIRTSEEDELRTIVVALGDINTPRSLLELIAIITRPNATLQVQQEAVAILTKRDVSGLQKELRATVQDLKIPLDPASSIAEIREALEGLLQVKDISPRGPRAQKDTENSPINDASLDDELGQMIPQYKSLSSEVKRALRTALFFNRSIAGSETSHAIDLSPLIDMQYKAMELLFREFFEDAASQALHRGEMPRKLDVIGYARPIPFKMDEFENYIANLPVVREIPFFSKFKLRKMLRAMCQFQPGKRFTLDGLKAFGLFFLCFSRTQCRFGLNELFPIGAKDDRELAEFAKTLHVFQDFRNRAAHEGFHPQASNDIVVQWAFRIRDHLNTPLSMPKQKIAS